MHDDPLGRRAIWRATIDGRHSKMGGKFTDQLQLRPEHGYVFLVLGLSFLTFFGLSLYVGLTRLKKFKVPYPTVG